MTDDLHDVLVRTADLAGPAHLDADALWRQGTRTKRLHSGMTMVGVLAVLTLVSLSVWWGTGTTTPRPTAPVTTGVTPAMPSTLYGVPADVHPSSSRLDVGPIAAAFTSDFGAPVAVSAIDGSYHALQLPGFGSTYGQANVLAVSPDGNRLAFGWSAPPPAVSGTHVNGGIRILNVATGKLRTLLVPGGLGALCGAISWSPHGVWLAAWCMLPSSYDTHGLGGTGSVERIRVATGEVEELPGPVMPSHLAVADNGRVVAAGSGSIMGWGIVSPGEVPPVQSLRFGPSSVDWLGPSSLVVASDVRQNLQVLQITENRSAQERYGDARYIPLNGHGVMTGGVRFNEVAIVVERGDIGELDTYSPGSGVLRRVSIEQMNEHTSYSFATDLLRRPTRATPAPHWPTDWSARLIAAAPDIAVGIAVGLFILWRAISRRRRRMLREV